MNTTILFEITLLGIMLFWFVRIICPRSSRSGPIDIRKEWNETPTPPPPTPRPASSRKTYVLKADVHELVHMPEPTNRLFTYQDERRAAAARQRLWIRYQDKSGHVTERVIEIYHPENDEVVFAWCCLKREPRTFARRSVQSWQLLPERFDFDPIVAQYWDEEGTLDLSEKLPWRRWLQQQPADVATRYQ